MGSFSIWHWIIVLVVVLLVFGTGRLRNAGRDLGEAVKGFKKGLSDDDKPPRALDDQSDKAGNDASRIRQDDNAPR